MRPIAIHLPQFHPIPENNRWWGKGFTEWTNVTKARPLFKGHYQPRLPSDLGFYDLRLEEARIAQEALAKQYGIYGFCYYHYWFTGKRLLNDPIDRKLNNLKEDLPFMLCWANETWSRRWLGEEKDVLIKQEYNKDDDIIHARWLATNAFADSRYIKIDNRPAFIIYRPSDLPDYRRTIDTIKNVSISLGFPEPYIIGSNSHPSQLNGFDKVLNFEPQLGVLDNIFDDKSSIKKFLRNLSLGIISTKLKVYDYAKVKKLMSNRDFSNDMFPCVFVGWDNSARKGSDGIIFINQNSNDFKESLVRAKNLVKQYPKDEQLVFINAWNEWAEGNHLEPDRLHGYSFLNVVKQVFSE